MFGRGKAAIAALVEAHNLARSEWVKDRAKLEHELRMDRIRIIYLEKALTASQANVDWMRHQVNQANNDRAAIAASKGLELPNPQIEGQPQTPQQVEARATAAANTPAEEGRNFADIEDLDDALAAYAGHVGNFEDVGDEMADRMGIRHAEDGTVEYAKK